MKFTKMQATGNDFVLVESPKKRRDWSKLAVAMCHHHFGIGADGLLLLLPSKVASFGMRMFNPDGSEAEACGNGLRCLVRYAVDTGLAQPKSQVSVETKSGIRKAQVTATRIQVSMGKPAFKAEEIPVIVDLLDITPIKDYCLILDGVKLSLTFVSMGNPHAVAFLSQPVEDFPLAELGAKVEHLPIFPQRTNFEIVNVLDRAHLKARVWERGAEETLSCGSGACAIGVAARLGGLVDNPVDIALPGGTLTVEWDGKGEVWLSGAAEMVFTGEWPE